MPRASGAGTKALRIAVLYGGRFIEERLFQKTKSVSVGQTAGCSLVLPEPRLPCAHTLFEVGRRGQLLRLLPGMELELSSGGEPLDLARLEALGLAKRTGDLWLVPLGDRARGRIRIGEATLLFQLTLPPPRAPRERLPAAARGALWRGWDKGFAAALGFALLSNFGTVHAVTLREPRPEEELRLEELPERISRVVLPLPKTKLTPPKTAAAPDAERRGRPRSDPAPARAPATAHSLDAKALERKVREIGVIGAINKLEEHGSGAFDVFSQGVDSQEIAKAFRDVAAVRTASREPLGGVERRGVAPGRAATIGELGTEGAAGERARLETRAVAAVHGRIVDEGPELEATTCDREVIGRYVKGQLPRVQSCFERVLKRNPRLQGKLLFRFAIDASGRVSEVEVEEDSLRESEVRACTTAAIRLWRFPVRGSGCEVSYPFVFVPSGN